MQILIDTDPGIDDAIALLLALQCPDLDVVGITTVAGNVGLEQATRNAAGLLQLAERTDIPLHYGAAGPLSGPSRSSAAHGLDGLGGVALPHDRVEAAPDAARFIVDTVNANPGEVTLVTIGPLTNLALALELDPGLAGKTGGLMMMGGAEGAGNITPSAEFNFWCDPPAAQRVLAAGFPNPIMVGLDATHQAFMSPGVRELLYRTFHLPDHARVRRLLLADAPPGRGRVVRCAGHCAIEPPTAGEAGGRPCGDQHPRYY